MKMKQTCSLVCAAVLALAASALAEERAVEKKQPPSGSQKAAKTSAPATTSAASSKFPVIGHLEKRGQIITIKAGSKGPLYSAMTAEGKMLFEDLTPEQLRAKAPEIHEFIKTAVGSGNRKSGAVIDASLRSQFDR